VSFCYLYSSHLATVRPRVRVLRVRFWVFFANWCTSICSLVCACLPANPVRRPLDPLLLTPRGTYSAQSRLHLRLGSFFLEVSLLVIHGYYFPCSLSQYCLALIRSQILRPRPNFNSTPSAHTVYPTQLSVALLSLHTTPTGVAPLGGASRANQRAGIRKH
jgi:hypothetical protein